jgi:hypothetical protein
MPPLAQQQQARQYAVIGLSLMCLATLIIHALLILSDPSLNSTLNPANKSPAPSLSPSPLPPGAALMLGVGVLVICAWVMGFLMWGICLGVVSVTVRNWAMIYSLAAANAALVYVLLVMPEVSGMVYMACTMWPLYMGMGIGTLM